MRAEERREVVHKKLVVCPHYQISRLPRLIPFFSIFFEQPVGEMIRRMVSKSVN